MKHAKLVRQQLKNGLTAQVCHSSGKYGSRLSSWFTSSDRYIDSQHDRTTLKGRLVDVTLEDYYLDTTHHVEDFDLEVDQDMIDCAKVYVDYVQKNEQKRLNGKLLVEQKLDAKKYQKIYTVMQTH